MTHIPDEAVMAPERIRVAQDAEGFWTCREAISGSQEYIRADIAEASLSAPCAIEVGNLEWDTVWEYGLEYRSKTSIGFYSIHTDEDSAGGRMFCYFHLTEDADCTKYGREIYSGYGGDDEAKDAAQADFERRILSCVVTKPVDVAAYREALERISKFDRTHGSWETIAYDAINIAGRALSDEPA